MIYVFCFMSLWSIRLGFVAIAHPRDFVMLPKRYSLFLLPNERVYSPVSGAPSSGRLTDKIKRRTFASGPLPAVSHETGIVRCFRYRHSFHFHRIERVSWGGLIWFNAFDLDDQLPSNELMKQTLGDPDL